MSTRAVIVPSGGANYGSLIQACARVGVDVALATDPKRILAASHVILPGVGAAAQAMSALRASGLDRVLHKVTQPLLGICLGMQILFEQSEEGADECLGLLPGRVRRLPPSPRWPHMGWNTLHGISDHALLDGIGESDWFYFVHGYAARVGDGTLARCTHGEPFSAVVARGNVHGTQFHPEKSASAGRRVLANFLALT